jgi:meiotically up-regulated gene 157 (Mug157) protein
MKPELHERKWEIDSLCYPVRLAHGYWKQTGDASCFDADWRKAAALIVQTFREQQRLSGRGPYRFQRVTATPGDSLPQGGYGNPTKPCGLIHSGFRPSDDACIFPFLIPSNLFAVTALDQLREIHTAVTGDAAAAHDCEELAARVREALAKYATAVKPSYGQVYAYEVDGFGNQLFQDDANVPSLLALPYLGCCAPGDPLYQRTRKLVLSDDNPYFFRGKAAEGLGGPHSGANMIWPLGIITRALTSQDETEVAACLATLRATHAGTGFMHESFSKDDAARFTRPWFAWANTLFGELILHVHEQYPRLLA